MKWWLGGLWWALVVQGSRGTTPKVEHVVVLVMENRAFDHMFGFAGEVVAGVDGLVGTESNPVDPSDPSAGSVSVLDGNASYVCRAKPSQALSTWCADFFGPGASNCSSAPYPSEQPRNGWVYENEPEVMYPFHPAQLPVKMALAAEFGLMDRYYSSFPGPVRKFQCSPCVCPLAKTLPDDVLFCAQSTPNHLFIQSGTAAGCTTTGATYRCDGSAFPQKTIYQALEEKNRTWAYYYNDTAWNQFLEFFTTPAGAKGVLTYDSFYASCETGELPDFAFILPRQGTNASTGDGPNDDHPCHDVALGERLLKDTYEALRSSPNWNSTLFIVTYDDGGGFYDHVKLVRDVPKPDDEPASCPDQTDYTLLGPRLPTLVISPLIPKGTVVHDPVEPVGTKGRPFENSKFEHSSILATVEHVFGLEALTNRDAWAASLLPILTLSEPRVDTLLHTPEPPEKAHPSFVATHGCAPTNRLTRRHLRRIRHLATHVDGLDAHAIDALLADQLAHPADAEAWINAKALQALRIARRSGPPGNEF